MMRCPGTCGMSKKKKKGHVLPARPPAIPPVGPAATPGPPPGDRPARLAGVRAGGRPPARPIARAQPLALFLSFRAGGGTQAAAARRGASAQRGAACTPAKPATIRVARMGGRGRPIGAGGQGTGLRPPRPHWRGEARARWACAHCPERKEGGRAGGRAPAFRAPSPPQAGSRHSQGLACARGGRQAAAILARRGPVTRLSPTHLD